YKILVPPGWSSFDVIEKPPAFLFHGAVNHVYFEVTFLEGSTEDAAALVRRYAAPFKARTVESNPLEVAGIPFVGTKLRQLTDKELKKATVEVFAGTVGHDAVVFIVSRLNEDASDAQRQLCISMVDAAIIRQMNIDPTPWTRDQK